ncbi:MAG: CHASE2 domain-containing protein [Aquitalea sp.]|nr:CHASE2 domain-containing protein [Aquitalea sp.]
MPSLITRQSKLLLPLLTGLAGLLLVLTGVTQRLDYWFYDAALSHHTLQRAADDPILIEVDNHSLAEMGSWPWPRELHARLIDQLQYAKAVGLDIVLAESVMASSRPDQSLATAMQRNGKVVSPVFPESSGNTLTETRPIPLLAAASNRLGHTDFERDGDGVIRRVYLQAGLGSPDFPAFAQAILDVAQGRPAPALPALFESPGASWVRQQEVMLPFGKGEEPFQRMSYIDALASASKEEFRDRIVLIGVTATGLGDMHSTPVSDNASGMPGVVINAYLLHGLLHGDSIQPLSLPQQLGLTLLLIVLLDYLLSPWWRRRGVMPAYAVTALLLAAGSLMLLSWGRIWFAPASAILALLLSGFCRFILRQASLQTLATTDGLTQLANRRHFDEVFALSLERQRHASQPLAFVLLDIDHFKLYNDQYGHYAGDVVLKRVAHVLRESFQRKGELPARLGGEEFGVLMPGSTMQDALEAAEGFRQHLESLDLPHDGSPLHKVTCSIGVAARIPQPDDTYQRIYEDADGALYIAKRSGRNIVSPASR